MSKTEAPKTDAEIAGEPEVAQEGEAEEDTSINNSDVVTKYKKAAAWANEVVAELAKLAVPGAVVGELCKKGDDLINEKVKTLFKSAKFKGVAFPTCISVGPCVCHNSPLESDDPVSFAQKLALNDLVHIDLGVHVDGYIAVVAHTVLVTEAGGNGDIAPDSKEANVIAAAYAALNVALRSFRPGQSLYDVTRVIEKVAEVYKVTVVDGVLSHMMRRYIVDSARCIVGKDVPEHKVHDYIFEPASVWTLDVVFTTGKGKLKERDAKASVFKVSLDNEYQPKLGAAAELQKEINEKFQTMPFSVRACANKKTRLGLSEMLRHNVCAPYPVLYEKDDAAVAHFKTTLFITNSKIERLTGLPPQKGATALPLEADEALVAASKLSMTFVEKEKKEKK